MAYQNPQFLFPNILLDEGATLEVWSTGAGFVSNIFDGLDATKATFPDASPAVEFIEFDRGASTPREEITACVVARGHDMGGSDLVRVVTTPTTGSGYTNISNATSAIEGEAFVVTCDQGTATNRTDRYVRFIFDTHPSVSHSVGELFFCQLRETTRGPVPLAGSDDWDDLTERTQMRSGIRADVKLGEQLRRISEQYRRLKGADITLFEDLFTNGLEKPFYFRPMFDDSEPLIVQFAARPSMRRDMAAPASDEDARQVRFELLEFPG